MKEDHLRKNFLPIVPEGAKKRPEGAISGKSHREQTIPKGRHKILFAVTKGCKYNWRWTPYGGGSKDRKPPFIQEGKLYTAIRHPVPERKV